jgi:isopentenyl-diphosphate delta-isomerase
MKEFVITVDPNDHPLGMAEKIEAHRKALLHRAFSVFIFNEKNELLLHQRAIRKYHSGGKWTNTCCGHPRPGEDTIKAAQRRLEEEMGFVCPLEYRFTFTYKAALDNELTEHEVDHVFFGFYNGVPQANPDEVMGFKWSKLEELEKEIKVYPGNFTEWFKICFDEVIHHQSTI